MERIADGSIVLAVLPPVKNTIRGRRLLLLCSLAGGAPLEFCKIAYCASAARLKTRFYNCVRFYCHFKDQCRNSEILQRVILLKFEKMRLYV